MKVGAKSPFAPERGFADTGTAGVPPATPPVPPPTYTNLSPSSPSIPPPDSLNLDVHGNPITMKTSIPIVNQLDCNKYPFPTSKGSVELR